MQQETKRVCAHAVTRPERIRFLDRLAPACARRGLAVAAVTLAATVLAQSARAQQCQAEVILDISGPAPQFLQDAGFGDSIRRHASAAIATEGLDCTLDGVAHAGRSVVTAVAHGRTLRAVNGSDSGVAAAASSMSDEFSITFAEPIAEPIVLRFDFSAIGETSYEFADPNLSCVGSSMINYSITLDPTPGFTLANGGTREFGVSQLFENGEFGLDPYTVDTGEWGDLGFAVQLLPGMTHFSARLRMTAGAVVIIRSTDAGDGPDAGSNPGLAVRWHGMRPIERLDGTPVRLAYTVASDSGYNFVRPEDVDFDGEVTAADLSRVLVSWGTAPVAEDIDQDGIVTATDMARVLQAWGR